MDKSDKSDIERFMSHVLWLNARVLGLALGLLAALAVFVATNWLVLKGGDPVGPHLRLLGQYFLGYRVSFAGSLVGAAYGFVLGGLGGMLVAWLYNRIAAWRNGDGRGGPHR